MTVQLPGSQSMAHNLVLDILLYPCINTDRNICCDTLLEIQVRSVFSGLFITLKVKISKRGNSVPFEIVPNV